MPETYEQKRLKFWHVLLGIFILLIFTWITFYMRSRAEFAAAMDKVRAAGHPITFAELNEWYSIPPGEQNAADTILEALSYYNEWDREKTKPLPVIGEKELLPDELYDPNTLNLARQYLADNKEMLDLLHEAAKIKHARYPADFEMGQAVLLQHLRPLRDAVRLISIEAQVQIENNQPQKALQTLETMKAISHSLANEPILISQLVLIACDNLTINTAERLISRCDLSQAQLNRLANLIASMQANSPMKTGFIGERCFMVSYIADSSTAAMNGGGSGMRFAYAGLRISGLAYNDGVTNIEIQTQAIDLFKLPLADRLTAADAIDKKIKALGYLNFFTKITMPAIVRVIQRDVKYAANLDVAQTAIAVEKYKRTTGNLPKNLIDLTPEYIKEIPTDPFDGKPLRYKKTEKGFIVYSIGQDKTDDGGLKGKKSTGDITFQINP
ncbi:MAG: hypothetical protein FVQ79_09810 [Planctomycetes bacterium]|nr:hypothetical protein [Planctomycetota bacterium]